MIPLTKRNIKGADFKQNTQTGCEEQNYSENVHVPGPYPPGRGGGGGGGGVAGAC